MSDPQREQAMEARVMDDPLAEAKARWEHSDYSAGQQWNFDTLGMCRQSAKTYINALESRIAELERDAGRLRAACQRFCDKVERGEARSTATYNEMKPLLVAMKAEEEGK